MSTPLVHLTSGDNLQYRRQPSGNFKAEVYGRCRGAKQTTIMLPNS